MNPIARFALSFAAAGFLAATFLGCSSDRGNRYGAVDRDAAPPAPPPEMEAHGMFFANQLEAEVVLNRVGFGPRDNAAPAGGGAARSGGGGRGGFSGGFGGGRRGGGGGGRGGGGSAARESDDGRPVPRITVSNQPPVRLHLRLTNHGSEPLEVAVTDFNSDLGNFVVQPPQITIPAGGSAEVDPMTSRLGVTADTIPLTVTIKAGTRVDKQVLTLRIKPDASGGAVAPAGPAAPAAPAGPPATTP